MQSNNQTTETPKLRIVATVKETTTVSIEKDLSLPYYFKDEKGGEVYKVVSKEFSIRIYDKKGWWRINVLPTDMYENEIASGTPISEFEFDAAYQKAMMYVDLINRNEDPLKEEDENVQIDSIIENRRAS